ncbi:MAG: VanZ family protein [Saprospiraceae bacterium]
MNLLPTKQMRRRILTTSTALLFFLFICWIIIRADLNQSSELVKTLRHIKYGDKAGHFLLYGTLAFLVNLAFNNRWIRITSFRILLGSLLVGTFAILEEFTQIALSSRTFEWWDMACDVTGIWLFSKLALRIEHIWRGDRLL